MTNKGIAKIPLFEEVSSKMDCPLFGVPTVCIIGIDEQDLLKRTTVVGPNKGITKVSENGSNKGIFPLFARFPYFKNFHKMSAKTFKNYEIITPDKHKPSITVL